MDDDLEFDAVIDDFCYECAHDSRYCYVHTHEAEMTRHAMDGWAKLERMRERKMHDDIRTKRLATLRNMADHLHEMTVETARMVAAAENDDDKLSKLRHKVFLAANYASYCWSEEARAAEES